VSRSGVLDRRGNRARIRARSRTGHGGGPRWRRPLDTPVQRLRPPAAPALRVVPAVRARILYGGVPGPVLRHGATTSHVPGPRHRLCRLLAAEPRDPVLGHALLPARPAATPLPIRDAAREAEGGSLRLISPSGDSDKRCSPRYASGRI